LLDRTEEDVGGFNVSVDYVVTVYIVEPRDASRGNRLELYEKLLREVVAVEKMRKILQRQGDKVHHEAVVLCREAMEGNYIFCCFRIGHEKGQDSRLLEGNISGYPPFDCFDCEEFGSRHSSLGEIFGFGYAGRPPNRAPLALADAVLKA